MTDISIEINGIDPPRRWLMTAPVALLRDIHDTVREAGPLVQGAVRANTSVRTGGLLASEQLSVHEDNLGGSARVWSDLRYTRYVERGTAQHGGPQYMFLHGVIASRPTIERIFDYNIRRTVG